MEPSQYASGQKLPGTVYVVVRHLATGGMGSVYDVEDVTVGKRYVLKTLHPQLVDRDDLAKRMEAEARVLAKLAHPNIVDVVTAGVTSDARRVPFYVMERLNGQNLRLILEKKGALEIAHCCRIAIDVLDALEHAHENGVVHRDVKPENVFLHRGANGVTVTKLLDFGIMRLLDQKESQTRGTFLGTLRYTSPEQLLGGELGPASDLYSLGAVLYEMIAGRGPFDDAGDAYAIGRAHAHVEAPPVSRFAPNVPRALERVVTAALAKDAAQRPRDAFSFAGELRRILREDEATRSGATTANALGAPDAGMTELGMIAPSTPALDAGVASRTTPALDAGVASRTTPALDAGVADTESAEATVTSEGPRERTARAPVDRSATTRARFERSTPRGAQNGTIAEEAGEDDEGASRASRRPPRLRLPSGATGPLAGEASTRPPERSAFLPLIAAAAFGALLVGVAVMLVTRRAPPEERARAAPAATTPATTTPAAPALVSASPPVAPTPAVTATPTAAVIASASASASPASERAPARAHAPHAHGATRTPRPAASAGAVKGPPRPEDVGFE